MNLENENIDTLFNKEWLETNGIGGYASSSIAGANTRKYHGLLVAALNPPTDRRVFVSKVEERIIEGNDTYDISVNQYPGTVYPQGHHYLKSFERKPISTWIYEGKNWTLQKKLFMVPQSNTTVVTYENIGGWEFDIELHPLLANKDYHSTFRENDFDFYYESDQSNIKVYAYPDSSPLFLNWSKGKFTESRAWYKNIELPKEQYRGQDFIEDYYRIGYVTTTLKKGQRISLLMTTDENMVGKKAPALEMKTIDRINSLKDQNVEHTFYNDLLVSGNQFLVDRASTGSKTIIAGYHWFTDWGRDTMIAMRGLTIARGEKEATKSILSTFLKYLDEGMLPNRFPDYDGQEVEYNTIDATMWLFVAMYEYQQKFGDLDFVEDNLKALESVLLFHINGTRFNIHLTEEGFICGGQESWQLTWMDAKVGDYVVTPRVGCPVEINALWYNAMCIYEHFCGGCDLKLHQQIKEAKEKFQQNFKKKFLNRQGYLYDVLTSNGDTDACFRPNQIYAVSLPFSVLSKTQEKKIVKLVGDKLLTDYGLRTLDKENPLFIGHYEGNQWDRDIAYHMGTVWPFLLMEYWQAYLKVNDFSEKAKLKVVKALKPLEEHFYKADGLHCISEIFDGENPKAGRGCIQQAWSVAALVKLYTEHQLYNVKTD